ncbi:MAG: hypothetical protein KF900_05625 [Bacteroidetes bacterium]|nr:hypothetical protein [Bacteroidota bacterium]
MKKIVMIAAVVALSMASCKKDYTCECSGGSIPAGLAKIEYKKVKKKDAQSSCDALSSTYAIYGTGISCELK